MSIVNLNDLLPPAPPGGTNVKWQWQLYPDGTNRYVSAYINVFGLGHFADAEVPSGVLDGVNRVFTLANAPNPPDSLILVYNGAVQAQGINYELSGVTITFLFTPPLPVVAKEWIRAWYRW